MKALKIIRFFEKEYGIKRPTANNPFLTLIKCILSQRTRDENTERASRALFKIARTPQQILELSESRLRKIIRPAGFYRNKAKTIRAVSKMILEKYGGKTPKTRQELLTLPGVGFKTADVTLAYGWGIPAIPVDTHVSQISKRLGLARPGDDVEDVRKKLERTFPKNRWYVVNHGMVRFGREICKPIRPLCIKNRDLCPFSDFCRAYKTKKFNVR